LIVNLPGITHAFFFCFGYAASSRAHSTFYHVADQDHLASKIQGQISTRLHLKSLCSQESFEIYYSVQWLG
jgi:hypothetical protein